MSDTDGERLAFMRQTGKPIWSYTCSAYRGSPALRPYRWHGWFTFHYHLDGQGTWHYHGMNCGLVGYPDEVGMEAGEDGWWVIWSPRLFAWTDGIEDHMYLTMLQRYVDRNPNALRANEVRRMLEDAVAEVLANAGDPEVYRRWHNKLGQTIERLNLPTLEVE